MDLRLNPIIVGCGVIIHPNGFTTSQQNNIFQIIFSNFSDSTYALLSAVCCASYLKQIAGSPIIWNFSFNIVKGKAGWYQIFINIIETNCPVKKKVALSISSVPANHHTSISLRRLLTMLSSLKASEE
jgi:hypothetical protein